MSTYETTEMDLAKAQKLVESGTGRIMKRWRDGEKSLCLVEVGTKPSKSHVDRSKAHTERSEDDPEGARTEKPQPAVEEDSSE